MGMGEAVSVLYSVVRGWVMGGGGRLYQYSMVEYGAVKEPAFSKQALSNRVSVQQSVCWCV